MKWIALVPQKNQLYVHKGGLQDNLLQECHDGALARHIGGKHIASLLKMSYYLKDETKECINTYLTCQN
jgi:hypothetical protein